MNPNPVEFRSGVISPVECVKEGWQLIKDQYWLFSGLLSWRCSSAGRCL